MNELEELKEGNRYKIIELLIKKITTAIIILIIVSGICLCIKELAGKTTFAKVIVDFVADIKYASTIAYGVGATGWGLYERKNRKKDRVGYVKRINELELKLNPKKQTSNLTKTGDTNKEDM